MKGGGYMKRCNKKISDKMEIIMVEGQANSSCLYDCKRKVWTGNQPCYDRHNPACRYSYHVDSLFTTGW